MCDNSRIFCLNVVILTIIMSTILLTITSEIVNDIAIVSMSINRLKKTPIKAKIAEA